MHEEIDGAISPEGKSALRAFLDANPEAQAHYRELRGLSMTLSCVADVEPPADLKAAILRSVRQAAERPQRGFLAWLPGLWPEGRVVLRYAYAAAAGLLLGVVIMRWGPTWKSGTGEFDPSSLVGTMARQGHGAASTVLQEIPVRFSEGGGTARVLRTGAGCTVEFDLDARTSVQVILDYKASDLDFQGLAGDSGAIEALEARAGRIAWTQTGRHRLAVLLTPRTQAPSELNLEFRVEGGSVTTGRISLPVQG